MLCHWIRAPHPGRRMASSLQQAPRSWSTSPASLSGHDALRFGGWVQSSSWRWWSGWWWLAVERIVLRMKVPSHQSAALRRPPGHGYYNIAEMMEHRCLDGPDMCTLQDQQRGPILFCVRVGLLDMNGGIDTPSNTATAVQQPANPPTSIKVYMLRAEHQPVSIDLLLLPSSYPRL
ncbi:hypothetical protein K432DRAFT_183050 [Lepidopterella palustris CBS 459.81]|uniref:Uncharacterized protein n=1 Tax=Lepidopterella palustris CBS 459.81 TaxID=1314670 RepID=A0A8E2EGH5_9PEZI|nr:hypothetical protein K432DRAFT_183050 [Lepidopterella palustris CBS 459.81]